MTNDEDKISDIPPGTLDALEDAGWMAAALFITEIGNQVFGGTAMLIALPDPEGYYQTQRGKEKTKPGIFVEISSMNVEGLTASLVVPYEIEAFTEIRYVMANLMGQLRTAEMNKMDPSTKLLVPEKRIILPGHE